MGYGWMELINFIMQKEPQVFCEECGRKQKLIQKYLSLIDLLKKKSDRSIMSTTPRSHDASPENIYSHPASQLIHKAPLVFFIQKLVCSRKAEALMQLKQLDLESRCHKGFLFVSAIERILNRRVIQSAKKLFLERGEEGGRGRELLQGRGIDRSSRVNLSYCSLSAFLQGQKREKLKGLTRRVFELTQEVLLLRQQKRVSDEQIEQNLRRQQVQSKKKKESLEMLAEEMAEKNEIIAQLQATLSFYEEREGKLDNNVLQEDGLALKREMQKMEKLNQKLGVQLQRKGQQLQRSEEELSKTKQRLSKLQAEYSQLKEKNFQLGIQVQDLQKKRQEYASLSQFLEKKLSSLKKYERAITVNLRAIEQASLSDRSSFNSSLRPKHSRLVVQQPASQANIDGQLAPIARFEAQYKIEKILNYLYNIQLDDVWIANDQSLFDQEQLNVLNELKLKFVHLSQQLNAKPKNQPPPEPVVIAVPARLSKECGQSDEVYFNEQHVSGSIFDVFASEKAQRQKQGRSVSDFNNGSGGNGEATTRRAEKGFTIKLLQMQIEKAKQVQKISQLKNKLFHIRSIVMNLIKSLQLKNIKPDTRDIIDVCFEFFEYSEEEKEIIFHSQNKKEKRFLGFF